MARVASEFPKPGCVRVLLLTSKDGGQPKCPQWLLLWEFSPFQLLCLLRLLHVFLGDVGVPVLLPSAFVFASVPSYWQREDRTPVLHFHFQVTETVITWLLFEPELERQLLRDDYFFATAKKTLFFLRKLYSKSDNKCIKL
ncbi:hypothetical protein Zmor_003652 [Zophobas morio]|uniref:Uncharacterized protein n=1 Tax=Zophobas morio TaxID=2755281 RepID=A0AA38HNA2_9CUCU|nr:hypothetical protein Zmor_003652 [Zophobas morio]